MSDTKTAVSYDIQKVLEALPHRYPLLLVDRVVSLTIGESIHAVKAVTFNEQFFQGHFPTEPVMPGVLIIEAMAQTSAVLVVETLGSEMRGKLVYFMSIESAKFRRPVVPGDQLRIKVTKLQKRMRVWKIRGEATVDGRVVAEATFAAMIRDR